MTWNIRTGVGNDPADPQGRVPSDLDRIAEVIREIDPDVVALQEVDRNRDRTGYVDQAAVLAAALGMEGRYGANLVDESGEYGIATLSRLPILNCRHDLFASPEGWEPRGVLEVLVDAGESGPVSVLNTHLQIGFDGNEAEALEQRRESARILASRMRDADMPAVLMGDFNAEPDSPELEALSVMIDAWIAAGDGGDGGTFPSSSLRRPNSRIDAIFAVPGLSVASCAVVLSNVTDLASDHYPVVADVG